MPTTKAIHGSEHCRPVRLDIFDEASLIRLASTSGIPCQVMSSSSGMNRIICSDEGKREICNEPSIAVETYPIYYGCGIDGRDHDIPTSQGLSNGIVLYYTPTNDPVIEDASPSQTLWKGESRELPAEITPSTTTRSHPTGISTEYKKQPPASRDLRVREGGSWNRITLAGLPAEPEVIMSHGGSRGIEAEAFKQLCAGIARRFAVLAFQKDRGDTKDAEVTRTAGFSSFWLMNDISGKAMGGRSRGARCATLASVYSSNKNLILWSYPLVRNYDVRKQELLALSSDTRVLFIKGTKDWMAPELIFGPVRREMKAKSWCIYVENMSHNFNCKSDLEEQKICNAIGTLAGIWLNGDPEDNNTPWNPEDGTEMGMAWDLKREEIVWTEWQPLGDKPPQPSIVQNDIAGLG